jgi:hypothetical protein
MQRGKQRNQRGNRKVLLAVPVVWVALAGMQAAATADDGGQADAGVDANTGPATYGRNGGGPCSVAGDSHGFGTFFGAGCC